MDIVSKNKLATVVISIAAFLRLYRLEEFTTFLSDQGRDAIIVRDIATLTHFTAIGAPSSIGQIFLGPFYYYLVAPFLLLFNFNPVGMAFGVAFFTILGLILFYTGIKKEASYLTAIYFAILATFSFVNIELSRFSWNPNLLPVFCFATLYLYYMYIEKKTIVYSLLFGSFLSLAIQLHHLAVFLILPIGFISLQTILTDKGRVKFMRNLFFSIIGFIVFISPLFIFDIRHGFINTRNFITLFSKEQVISHGSLISGFLDVNQSFINNVFKVELSSFYAGAITLIIALLTLILLRKKKYGVLLELHLVSIFSFLVAFSFVNSFRHPHYYGVIYFSFFLILAFILSQLHTYKIFRYFAIPCLLVIYIYFNAINYYYFNPQGPNQVAYSKRIASFVGTQIGNAPYNIATWPVSFTEDNFVYFLILAGHTPADRKKLEITNQMFVLCIDKPCQVLNSPSWNISMFGKSKIDKIWKVENLTIYKLIHEK